MFAPSLFFGATLGAAYNNILHLALPSLDIGSTSAYASVGGAAVLASVSFLPLPPLLPPVMSCKCCREQVLVQKGCKRAVSTKELSQGGSRFGWVCKQVFRAPVTGVLLLFELTRNYDIVLPLIFTVGMGTLTIDVLEKANKDPTWSFAWAPDQDKPSADEAGNGKDAATDAPGEGDAGKRSSIPEDMRVLLASKTVGSGAKTSSVAAKDRADAE